MHIERNKLPKAAVPYPFEQHSKGYQRTALIDHSAGLVHQATGICQLEPNGSVDCCLHTYEETIYVLEGELEVMRDHEAFRLFADDFAFVPYGIPHAYRNTGNKTVRWFEAQSPQPKPPDRWQDTFFFDADWPKEVSRPNFDDPRTRFVGKFKEEGGQSPAGTGALGPTVHILISADFGSRHMMILRGSFPPGGKLGLHDHPVEESFFALSGEMDLEIEGTNYHIRPGDLAWAKVGAAHAFHNRGDVPFRWIETITPQFFAPTCRRIYSHWEKLRNLSKD